MICDERDDLFSLALLKGHGRASLLQKSSQPASSSHTSRCSQKGALRQWSQAVLMGSPRPSQFGQSSRPLSCSADNGLVSRLASHASRPGSAPYMPRPARHAGAACRCRPLRPPGCSCLWQIGQRKWLRSSCRYTPSDDLPARTADVGGD